MRGWNWLFFKPGIIMPDQQKSAEWNRGRYLVEGVGHCGACHTPKNMFGADKRGQAYGGNLVQGMFAPRLDARRAQRPEILERGRYRRISAERPQRQEPCRRTDVGGRGQFDVEDERCRYPRHRRLPEGPAGRRAGAEGRPAPSGANGRGRKTLQRRLHRLPRGRRIGRAADLSAVARQRQSAIGRSSSTLRIILDGAQTVTTPRAPNKGSMPGYAAKMSDQQIADVTNYIRNAWGNAAPLVTAAEVAKARKAK